MTTEILWHLREVEHRRLYAEQGYSSIFDYVRRGLGYCEGSADRRISAMRLLKALPEIESALKTGELSLSNASALQHFLKGEEKDRGKTYSHTAKKELVAKVTGKSRRDCDRLLAELAPEAPRAEHARPISATQTEIRFTAEETLLAKIEKLKALLSHRNPNPSYAELIEMLADMALKRLDPEQKPEVKEAQEPKQELKKKTLLATPPAEKSKAKRTRHIPQKLRSAVWKRDQVQCTFINKETGVRCGSKHLLEIHHLKDFSLGGKHTLDNLTLRCQCHNVHAAIQTYGSSLMNRYLKD
ncbi:MAG TPA: HNH endonuclease [Bdellovibrionota bacterium]|nr:HNH endonuclease [Bdellovibrionota bacterium]